MSGPEPKDRQVFSGSAQMAAAEYWRKQNRMPHSESRLSIAEFRRYADGTGQPTMQERAEEAATHKRIVLNIALLMTAFALVFSLIILWMANANGGEKWRDFSPEEMSMMRGVKR